MRVLKIGAKKREIKRIDVAGCAMFFGILLFSWSLVSVLLAYTYYMNPAQTALSSEGHIVYGLAVSFIAGIFMGAFLATLYNFVSSKTRGVYFETN